MIEEYTLLLRITEAEAATLDMLVCIRNFRDSLRRVIDAERTNQEGVANHGD